jgi:hypothetical protein
MAASPLANHTALVLLQQAIPSRCPYPRSTVHNSNLCPHLRSSHIAERYMSQISRIVQCHICVDVDCFLWTCDKEIKDFPLQELAN